LAKDWGAARQLRIALALPAANLNFNPMSVSASSSDSNKPQSAAPDSIPGDAHNFVRRHIGPRPKDARQMLDFLGYQSLEDLIDAVVPKAIRLNRPLNLPAPLTEHRALSNLRELAAGNEIWRSYIGMGYNDCVTPPVLLRNVMENPGWYTQYTPYQAEIAQGRLEALLNFQTMVIDLTGMEVANASLLDEATAAAEAMSMCHGIKSQRSQFFISETCHPQTINVVQTRAQALGIEVLVGDHRTFQFSDQVFGALVQYPDTFGEIHEYASFIEAAHTAGALVAVSADLLSLTLLKPPGEFGADIALGSAQRFGVPQGYGGPHAAYFATRDAFKRQMPGRIVGVSKDSRGQPALRLALQTREQHIRREKATSNICTAQALLANMASLYACYHGPAGLQAIARQVHGHARALAQALQTMGLTVKTRAFFDTLTIDLPAAIPASQVRARCASKKINLRWITESRLGISLDETTSLDDVRDLCWVLDPEKSTGLSFKLPVDDSSGFPQALLRQSRFMQAPVFNTHHSETEMMRYLKRLESRDLSLTSSMIPLGSCTMKLNAAVEMLPITWPEFSRLHPFVPAEQAAGYARLIRDLETWLAEITGFSAVSLQPNAGSQGEYSGLLVIRSFLHSQGKSNRNLCLIPASAHGTNPASAVMAGFNVLAVACDKNGNIDLADLRAKATANRDHLAALMVTYPSTHGVFEEGIKEICSIIHENGGQVYMDGANLNAQVGLCRPADIGADVCHMNLHKTFCIPHGGGGPGVGPIGVAKHLAPFLPGHPVVNQNGRPNGAVSAAPWGSASILPISWVYIALMGPGGLAEATKFAILNANYIARKISDCFPVLYQGHNGLVAHECILDLRHFKSVTVEDVAKRLMDYGFHAPTISWPVGGTMMVEPTESEPKEELDRFCDALRSIHAEMIAIETGRADKQNNLLKRAPHTADMIASDAWDRPYSREQACFPAPWQKQHKFWPACGRIDNVFGDRNLVCSCAGMEAYQA
jgi:glycine dehydrogenase